MSEYRISSADIAIRCDATIDELIDVVEAKNRRYIPVCSAGASLWAQVTMSGGAGDLCSQQDRFDHHRGVGSVISNT